MSRKILVVSLKGGTGKTTTCLALARSLSDSYKVGLLDIDIHASALPRALDLNKPPGYEALAGGLLMPVRYDGFQIFSIGLLFQENTPNMWSGEAKSSAVRQIVTTSVAWDEDLDWILVDTPPTSGEEIQSLLDNADIYGAVVVCQPNKLSVLGITKTMEVLREKQTPILGIIANMDGFMCPACGHVSALFDRDADDVKAVADGFKVAFLGSIPFADADRRKPFVEEIAKNMLQVKPVILKKEGGAIKWLLGKVLSRG